MSPLDPVRDPDFTMVPPESPISAQDALDAAEAAALEDPTAVPDTAAAPIPFGRSWAFDHQTGRHELANATPREVFGLESLVQWMMNALHTALGAHANLIGTGFGMEDPFDVIGAADPGEAVADLEDRIRDALLVHPRIVEVDDLEIDWDPIAGAVLIPAMVVVTDQAGDLPLTNLRVPLEVSP